MITDGTTTEPIAENDAARARPFTPNTGNEGQAIRKVAVTILIESDAECIDIAKSVRKILDDADCFTYQLGVAPVVQS